MNEPSIDFWDQFYDEQEWKAELREEALDPRPDFSHLSQEVKGEMLNDALDKIYASHPEKDPRKTS
jgi:hypothetical protein